MITPAISVLSAVEGIEVVGRALDELVVPITLAILAVLFAIQRFGTGAVGRLFGPVMARLVHAAGVARRCTRSPSTRDPARALAHLRALASCSSTATSRSSRSARSC